MGLTIETDESAMQRDSAARSVTEPVAVRSAFLAEAGRLLLEYNESTAAIHRSLADTASAVAAEPCYVTVTYNGVTVSLADEGPVMRPVKELRYNTALQTRVHAVLEQVQRKELDAANALRRLRSIEADTPHHPRWVTAAVLGVAAAALTASSGGDVPAALVAGLATALGLLARTALARRGCSLLALPLVAASIGSVLGGLAVRWGWTGTPELALIVPALMVVPGPHLINGLLDLIDNHLPMSIARLGLAAGILLSATVGVLMGMQLALPSEVLAARGSDVETPGLIVVMILAGVVTCGFAVFYNATWSQAALAVLGGMAGNGLRDIALDTGVPLDASTFLGGLAVGTVSAAITRSARIPVAVVGFAGAVTMMPGIHIYQAIGGILRFARLSEASNITVTMELATKLVAVCVVVGALTLGLLIGARIGLALSRRAN